MSCLIYNRDDNIVNLIILKYNSLFLIILDYRPHPYIDMRVQCDMSERMNNKTGPNKKAQ